VALFIKKIINERKANIKIVKISLLCSVFTFEIIPWLRVFSGVGVFSVCGSLFVKY